jgi:hypothetical protein
MECTVGYNTWICGIRRNTIRVLKARDESHFIKKVIKHFAIQHFNGWVVCFGIDWLRTGTGGELL